MTQDQFTIPYSVRVADVNYGGHVANSAVLNYFQDARIAFLKALGGYSELSIGAPAGLIMAEANVQYKKEMFLGDELTISVWISEIKRSSFIMQYRIARNGETTAEGSTAMVAFDYSKRTICRVPDEFKDAVAGFSPENR